MAKFLGLDLGSNMLRVAVFDGAAGEFGAPFERVVGSARGMDGAGLSAAAQARVRGAVAALVDELGLDFRAGKIRSRRADGGVNSNLTASATDGEICADGAGDFDGADEDFEYFAVATEAFRRAKNGGEFLAGLERDFGVKFALIDGEKEARLSFLGAAFGALKSGALGADGGDFGVGLGGCALVDLGGGSTEVCGFCGGGFAGAIAGADGADFADGVGSSNSNLARGRGFGGESAPKTPATNNAKTPAPNGDYSGNQTVKTTAQNGTQNGVNPAPNSNLARGADFGLTLNLGENHGGQNCENLAKFGDKNRENITQNGAEFAKNFAKNSAKNSAQNRENLAQNHSETPAKNSAKNHPETPAKNPAALAKLREICAHFPAFCSRSFKFGIIASSEQMLARLGGADSARLRAFLRGALQDSAHGGAARLGAFVRDVTGEARAFLRRTGARRLLLNSGVPTSVAAFKHGLAAASYDARRVSGTRLGRGDFAALLRWLLAASEGECERLVGAGRGGLVAAGILLLGGVLGWDLAGDFGTGGGANSNLAADGGDFGDDFGKNCENPRENGGENIAENPCQNRGENLRECGANSNLPHIAEIIAIDSGVGEGAALARFLGDFGGL